MNKIINFLYKQDYFVFVFWFVLLAVLTFCWYEFFCWLVGVL